MALIRCGSPSCGWLKVFFFFRKSKFWFTYLKVVKEFPQEQRIRFGHVTKSDVFDVDDHALAGEDADFFLINHHYRLHVLEQINQDVVGGVRGEYFRENHVIAFRGQVCENRTCSVNKSVATNK